MNRLPCEVRQATVKQERHGKECVHEPGFLPGAHSGSHKDGGGEDTMRLGHLHTDVCVYIYIHIHRRTHECVCIHTYTYMDVYLHIYIYTHIHVHVVLLSVYVLTILYVFDELFT